jgi:hypothetical protein
LLPIFDPRLITYSLHVIVSNYLFAVNLIVKNFHRRRARAQQKGGGENSAALERSHATLLGQSRSQQKSFLFLLLARRSHGAGGEEKIRRAEAKKLQRKLFCWLASVSERQQDRANWIFSEIFAKIVSNVIVKPH